MHAWIRQEFQCGQENRRAVLKRLRKFWKKRGTFEILAFFLEIERYAALYIRKHRAILEGVNR
jgi:hypothetical protein